ncbi:hypothetical protein [Kitasatospora sp. NPDC096204]|uniref:hypothetical protein n=1 Tax=Kitasatospora sp. NPDC096204 TaxID=3364094 RepID=UPI0038239F07
MEHPSAEFRQLPERYLRRPWQASDGLSSFDVETAEARIGQALPVSLRSFYLAAGACVELLNGYHEFVPIEALCTEDGHLVFAHENQDVVSWGFRVEDLGEPDPQVWQRVNDGSTDPPWYSEEKALADFLGEMFDFLGGGDVTAP